MEISIQLRPEQLDSILNQLPINEVKRASELLRKRIDQHTLDNFDMPLNDTGLSKRTLNALAKSKITMLKQLLDYEECELTYLKNIGKEGVKDIEEHVFSIYRKK